MAERLAAPLLAGVFAGDATRLSMDAAFPQLVALEKKYGSLFSGLNGGKSIWSVLTSEQEAAESPFLSLRKGLGQLVDRLVEQLAPGTLRLSSPVERLEPAKVGQAYPVVVTRAERITARHVVFAGPPWAARGLLGEIDGEMGRALGEIRGFPTATVFFGLDAARAQHDFSGSGFIVPPGEAEILASTFISTKWEHRAPEGRVLIRAFVGGGRKDISTTNEEQLVDLARGELSRLLGDLGPLLFSRVHRYERGTPQPELGFQRVLSRIQEPLRALPWLSLLGSGYGGVGIPDCVREANEIAKSLA
jgi:oxygen-dependent protoporphyrinogen oxidase